jgi:phospholipid N-methyltransferase
MATSSPTTGWREHLVFFGRFVRDPRTIASVVPSSRYLATAMVAPIDRCRKAGVQDDAERPLTIVELGAGTGAFTRLIADRLCSSDRFLGVELDPVFADGLRLDWPHLDFACASAESLRALVDERHIVGVDHIVSGLPFAAQRTQTTRQILDAVAAVLRPKGTFTTFHYVHSYRMPLAIEFRIAMNALMHSTPSIRVVKRNLPPALVLSWINRRPANSRSLT